MKLYDFQCNACGHKFEELMRPDDPAPICPACNTTSTTRLLGCTHTCNVIIPTTLHSKKLKAGYIHTHGDRPKTPGKIQVGYSGK